MMNSTNAAKNLHQLHSSSSSTRMHSSFQTNSRNSMNNNNNDKDSNTNMINLSNTSNNNNNNSHQLGQVSQIQQIYRYPDQIKLEGKQQDLQQVQVQIQGLQQEDSRFVLGQLDQMQGNGVLQQHQQSQVLSGGHSNNINTHNEGQFEFNGNAYEHSQSQQQHQQIAEGIVSSRNNIARSANVTRFQSVQSVPLAGQQQHQDDQQQQQQQQQQQSQQFQQFSQQQQEQAQHVPVLFGRSQQQQQQQQQINQLQQQQQQQLHQDSTNISLTPSPGFFSLTHIPQGQLLSQQSQGFMQQQQQSLSQQILNKQQQKMAEHDRLSASSQQSQLLQSSQQTSRIDSIRGEEQQQHQQQQQHQHQSQQQQQQSQHVSSDTIKTSKKSKKSITNISSTTTSITIPSIPSNISGNSNKNGQSQVGGGGIQLIKQQPHNSSQFHSTQGLDGQLNNNNNNNPSMKTSQQQQSSTYLQDTISQVYPSRQNPSGSTQISQISVIQKDTQLLQQQQQQQIKFPSQIGIFQQSLQQEQHQERDAQQQQYSKITQHIDEEDNHAKTIKNIKSVKAIKKKGKSKIAQGVSQEQFHQQTPIINQQLIDSLALDNNNNNMPTQQVSHQQQQAIFQDNNNSSNSNNLVKQQQQQQQLDQQAQIQLQLQQSSEQQVQSNIMSSSNDNLLLLQQQQKYIAKSYSNPSQQQNSLSRLQQQQQQQFLLPIGQQSASSGFRFDSNHIQQFEKGLSSQQQQSSPPSNHQNLQHHLPSISFGSFQHASLEQGQQLQQGNQKQQQQQQQNWINNNNQDQLIQYDDQHHLVGQIQQINPSIQSIQDASNNNTSRNKIIYPLMTKISASIQDSNINSNIFDDDKRKITNIISNSSNNNITANAVSTQNISSNSNISKKQQQRKINEGKEEEVQEEQGEGQVGGVQQQQDRTGVGNSIIQGSNPSVVVQSGDTMKRKRIRKNAKEVKSLNEPSSQNQTITLALMSYMEQRGMTEIAESEVKIFIDENIEKCKRPDGTKYRGDRKKIMKGSLTSNGVFTKHNNGSDQIIYALNRDEAAAFKTRTEIRMQNLTWKKKKNIKKKSAQDGQKKEILDNDQDKLDEIGNSRNQEFTMIKNQQIIMEGSNNGKNQMINHQNDTNNNLDDNIQLDDHMSFQPYSGVGDITEMNKIDKQQQQQHMHEYSFNGSKYQYIDSLQKVNLDLTYNNEQQQLQLQQHEHNNQDEFNQLNFDIKDQQLQQQAASSRLLKESIPKSNNLNNKRATVKDKHKSTHKIGNNINNSSNNPDGVGDTNELNIKNSISSNNVQLQQINSNNNLANQTTCTIQVHGSKEYLLDSNDNNEYSRDIINCDVFEANIKPYAELARLADEWKEAVIAIDDPLEQINRLISAQAQTEAKNHKNIHRQQNLTIEETDKECILEGVLAFYELFRPIINFNSSNHQQEPDQLQQLQGQHQQQRQHQHQHQHQNQQLFVPSQSEKQATQSNLIYPVQPQHSINLLLPPQLQTNILPSLSQVSSQKIKKIRANNNNNNKKKNINSSHGSNDINLTHSQPSKRIKVGQA